MPKLGVLTVNIVHSIEHYGNMVTYLRMKDIVPATRNPEFTKKIRRKRKAFGPVKPVRICRSPQLPVS